MVLVRTDGQWFAVVRERAAGMVTPAAVEAFDLDAYVELYQECVAWPLDYVMIEVMEGERRMRIRAGVLGSAPIYCRAQHDVILLSWDFADFLGVPFALDAEIAAHYLTLGTFYSARQICAGVTMLTERGSIYVAPGVANYCYPEAVEVVGPTDEQGGFDPAPRFRQLLHEVLTMRPIKESGATIELSGGMDSATVAVAARHTMGRLSSKGILLDGKHRYAQMERRNAIVAQLELRDSTVNMADFLPCLDLRTDARRKEHPLGEFYLEAFEAIWADARSEGAQYLLTGIGGDELFQLFAGEMAPERLSSETMIAEVGSYAESILTQRALTAARSMRLFDAPTSVVSMPTLLAHVCRAPYLLRRGLWPINPLSDPRLMEYCHALPLSARFQRTTMRKYLNLGLNAGIFPCTYAKETFARVLPELIAQEADRIASQLKDCALADFGLVDQRAVLNLLEEVAATRAEAPCAPLAFFLWLERFVRQVT
ncbi:asparagine synthase-related protein [Aminobacter sp. SS-2016]|nr:asparagine synthase-related protein [Aminobacter sp. SS-2016]